MPQFVQYNRIQIDLIERHNVPWINRSIQEEVTVGQQIRVHGNQKIEFVFAVRIIPCAQLRNRVGF